MPAPDATERVVFGIGASASAAASFGSPDMAWDYAIAGIPFMSAASERYAYERALAQVRKQQVDQSDQPGDQSLDGWWLRSATDWSGGAGQEFMEPIAQDVVQRSFYRSVGVDPWTSGKLSLHKATALVKSYATTPGVVWSDGVRVYAGLGATLDQVTPPSTVVACTGLSGTIADVTGGGGKVFVATNNGGTVSIYTASSGGTAFTSATTGITSTSPRLWWVKQRLIVADGPKLYVQSASYTGGISGGAGSVLHYTHPDSSFTWTACCEAPGAILLAGTSGSTSAVYRFELDTQGDLPVLSAAVTVAELPAGETITAMDSYLGAWLLLATTKGVRVAQLGDGGQLQYGPLSWEGTPTGRFAKWDVYAWIGTGDVGGGRAGLIRLDLSDVQDDGRAPWASDVQIPDVGSSGAVSGAVVFAGPAVWMLAKPTSGGTWSLYATGSNLESSGWLDTGLIRYGTLEPKTFAQMRLEVAHPFPGMVVVESYTAAYAYTSLSSFTSIANLSMPFAVLAPGTPQRSLGFRFTLARSDSDATKGPTLDAWQVRATPASHRGEMLQVPMLCFDFERDQRGVMVGYEGSALVRWKSLVAVVDDGAVVRWQDLNTGETLLVTVEDMVFRMVAPPEQASGLGGIIQVTMRSV